MRGPTRGRLCCQAWLWLVRGAFLRRPTLPPTPGEERGSSISGNGKSAPRIFIKFSHRVTLAPIILPHLSFREQRYRRNEATV